MIGGGAFLTEMSVSIYDPSRITSDFSFERAAPDTEYRAVVYESVDVSGYVLLAVVAFVVVAALAIGVVVIWRRRRRPRPRRADVCIECFHRRSRRRPYLIRRRRC